VGEGEPVRLPATNSGTGKQAILIPLQLAAFTLTAFYIVYRWSELRRRNQRSWQQIVSRLSHAWNGAGSLEPGDRTLFSADGLWAVYRDAGVMMELADYACRHGRDFDVSSVEDLRFTALSLRFTVLKALTRRISLR
jgi:hypothetical protein